MAKKKKRGRPASVVKAVRKKRRKKKTSARAAEVEQPSETAPRSEVGKKLLTPTRSVPICRTANLFIIVSDDGRVMDRRGAYVLPASNTDPLTFPTRHQAQAELSHIKAEAKEAGAGDINAYVAPMATEYTTAYAFDGQSITSAIVAADPDMSFNSFSQVVRKAAETLEAQLDAQDTSIAEAITVLNKSIAERDGTRLRLSSFWDKVRLSVG